MRGFTHGLFQAILPLVDLAMLLFFLSLKGTHHRQMPFMALKEFVKSSFDYCCCKRFFQIGLAFN
jgi:hypothetical protein